MNIKDIHSAEKALSIAKIFANEHTSVVSIHLQQGQEIKEHSTPIAALLFCLSGTVLYVDASGDTTTLQAQDFISILPDSKHKLNAIETCEILLIR